MAAALVGLLAPLGGGSAQAEIAEFRQGAGGYEGVADTFVDQAEPNGTRPRAEILMVRKRDGQKPDSATQAMLRFDGIFGDASGQVPTDALILQATLELHVSDNFGGYCDELELREMQIPFDPAFVTWAKLDGGLSSPRQVSPDPIVRFELSWDRKQRKGVQMVKLDVTDSLLRWQADPATNLGWAIWVDPASNMGPMHYDAIPLASSDEPTAEIRPKLTVEFTAGDAPE